MENTYLVTFSANKSDTVVKYLNQNFSDVKIDLLLDKYVTFSTSKSVIPVSNNKDINNIFFIAKRFDNLTGSYFKPIFQWSGRHSLEIIGKKAKGLGYKSFRLILNDKGKIRSGYRRAIKSLENKISKETGMIVNRVSPNTEVWLTYTVEKYGFILLKI